MGDLNDNPMLNEDSEELNVSNNSDGNSNVPVFSLPDLDDEILTDSSYDSVKNIVLPDGVEDDGNYLLDGHNLTRAVDPDDYNYRNVRYNDYDSGVGVRSKREVHPDTYSGVLDNITPLPDDIVLPDDNVMLPDDSMKLPDDVVDLPDVPQEALNENFTSVDNSLNKGSVIFDENEELDLDNSAFNSTLDSFSGFYKDKDGNSNGVDGLNSSVDDVLIDDDDSDEDNLNSPVFDLDSVIGEIAGELDKSFEEDLDEVKELSEGYDYFSNDMIDEDDLELDLEERIIKYFDLDEVIDYALAEGASDLHIVANKHVALTVRDEIKYVEKFGVLPPQLTRNLMLNMISNVLEAEFTDELELDTSYVVRSGPSKGRRSRVNISKTLNNIQMVFRLISDVIPEPDALGIPQFMQDWFMLPSGLILINGPTGTGKTTTLASLLNKINLTQPKKIVTVENPIEFLYGDGKGLVTQREVGQDTRSFNKALNSAMRQNPNIILIGEIRDKVEIDALVRSAESGHLAISTMHTTSGPATINRIMGSYISDEQGRILSTLADVSRGFANQTLVKTPDRKGMIAVREILPINDEIKDMIRVGDVASIRKYQVDNKITMEHELVREVHKGTVNVEDARPKAGFPEFFDDVMKQKFE